MVMDHFQISPLKKLPSSAFASVVEIFFESSTRKAFKNDIDKAEFQWKYLDFYQEYFSDYFFVAHKDENVLGYIAGSPITNGLNDLWKCLPHLELFHDLYEAYPAHLHINLGAMSRGLGVGSELLKKLEFQLKDDGISGIHLITSKDARNVTFYLKNNYTYQVERSYQSHPLLFMAKSL